MAMQGDVLSSDVFATSGFVVTCNLQQKLGRTRIKAVYYSASVNGLITFREGSATGSIRLIFPTTASASGLVLLPGEGILLLDSPYAVVTGTLTGATVFYG
jgi:hypothetical protein